MKKWDFLQYWKAFLRWKGWKAAAAACVKVWRGVLGWKLWRNIFGLPLALILVLSAGSAVGLVWIFANGLEQSLPGYCLYPVAAYSLTALCVRLPGGIQQARSWIGRHPKLAAVLKNDELHFRLGLYAEQIINFGYGIFKIVSGVVLGSAWVGCDGIYNLAQALIQLFQILRRKAAGTLLRQWKSYRLCGVLVLLMHLTLTGIVFQMVNWNRAEEQGEILVITTAFFAFYKITNSFVSLAKDRKHLHPVDSSVRMLNLAQAIFAIFSLQASMFHTFGTGAHWEQWMNLLTGSGVCLLIVSIGIYMIRRGSREIKKLQETQHG